MKTLSTHELEHLLAQNEITLIDCREPDAFNGWQLQGEVRGGHIPGAVSLPVKWTAYMDWIEMVRSKQILPQDKLVVYGYHLSDCQTVAQQLMQAGYPDVALYPHFVAEWCTQPSRPMEQLARYQHLVPASWLRQLLTSGQAPHFQQKRFVLVHAHYRNRQAYDDGHIPGAVELDTNQLESPKTWNRRSPQELKAALEQLGITHDTTVILYGRFDFPDNDDPFPGSSAGHLGAIRCALIMLYAGVQDVRILNGGLQSWQDAGYELETASTPKQAVPTFGTTIPAHPEYIVDLDEAKAILKDDQKNLVSVRSWPEYIGEVSGYNYIQKKGRIPGSVFGNCGSDAYHMENYRNLDHTTRAYPEIAALWAEAGITPDKVNAFYCGTGWRGSEAFFNAWLMGWPQVAVYDGGWYEWSNDERNPYETGQPKEGMMMNKGGQSNESTVNLSQTG